MKLHYKGVTSAALLGWGLVVGPTIAQGPKPINDVQELSVTLVHPDGAGANAIVKRGEEAWTKLIKGEAILRIRNGR